MSVLVLHADVVDKGLKLVEVLVGTSTVGGILGILLMLGTWFTAG